MAQCSSSQDDHTAANIAAPNAWSKSAVAQRKASTELTRTAGCSKRAAGSREPESRRPEADRHCARRFVPSRVGWGPMGGVPWWGGGLLSYARLHKLSSTVSTDCPPRPPFVPDPGKRGVPRSFRRAENRWNSTVTLSAKVPPGGTIAELNFFRGPDKTAP